MTAPIRNYFFFILGATAVLLLPCYTLPGSMVGAEGGFDVLLPRFPAGRTQGCPVPRLPVPAPPRKGTSAEEKATFPQKGAEENHPATSQQNEIYWI